LAPHHLRKKNKEMGSYAWLRRVGGRKTKGWVGMLGLRPLASYLFSKLSFHESFLDWFIFLSSWPNFFNCIIACNDDLLWSNPDLPDTFHLRWKRISITPNFHMTQLITLCGIEIFNQHSRFAVISTPPLACSIFQI